MWSPGKSSRMISHEQRFPLPVKMSGSFCKMARTAVAGQRIEGFDVARSLALFGMILVNFWALLDMNVSCPEWLTFVLCLIQGRAAATFVILAGVGLSLLSRNAFMSKDPAVHKITRRRIWRRAIFLFVVGTINAAIWPADILHCYALYFAVGAFLVFLTDKRLLALTVTPVLIFVILMAISNFDQGTDWGGLSFHEWPHLPRVLRHFLFNGYYPFFPWISFLIVGVWLGRQNLNDTRVRKRILVMSISGVFVSETFSWATYAIAESHTYSWQLEGILPWADIDPWAPMPLFMVSACGTALIAIITLYVCTERFRGASWLRPLVFAGQSTLTLYILHILMAEAGIRILKWRHVDTSLFPLVGGGLFFALSLVLCYLWKRRFDSGPLEWVMRRFFDKTLLRRAKAV